MKSRPLSPHESAAPISSPSPQPRQVGAVICLINSANCGASGPPVSGNVLLPVTGPLHTIRRSSYKVGAGSPRPREPRPQPQSPSPDTPEVGADISPIDFSVQWARGPYPIAADYLTGCMTVLGVEAVSSSSIPCEEQLSCQVADKLLGIAQVRCVKALCELII